ncbi:MAG: hypothetical protein HUU49_00805 [Candidatus Buchananbacteria bacterium]|nr:hypothetical protein [Candidatus Buchananbacteria bacterium]
MEEKLSQSQYVLISAILCFGLVFNITAWQNQIVALGLTFCYLLFLSFILGSIFIAKPGWQIMLGFVFLLALISLAGTVALLFLKLDDYFIISLVFLLPMLFITPYYYSHLRKKLSVKELIKNYLDKFDERRESKTNFLLAIAYLFFAAGGFYLLVQGQTTQSIQTPWQTVHQFFFPIYFIATTILATYLLRSHRTKGPLALIIIHTFLSTGIATIVYKIGYGFDPFIHQATERIISATGQIHPTPLYYLGQYAIVIFLAKISMIDLSLIDRVLVPALFSLIVGPTIFYVFNLWLHKNYALTLALAALVIPFSSFIMTAPQNLANVLFLITILLSLLYYRNQVDGMILYLLAFATTAVHPLAGIPLIIAVILLNLFKILYNSYSKYLTLYFLAAAVFVIFLPMAFLLNGSAINFDPDFKLTDISIAGWVNKFDLALNLVYLADLNRLIIASAIILLGIMYVTKRRLLKNNAPFLAAAAVLFADYLIIRYWLTFPSLRDNDQADFVSRLLVLTFYILLPFFLLGLSIIIKNLWEKDWFAKIFLVFAISGGLSISLYLSYPALDRYQPAKFFSVSESDIKAVNFIEQIASPDHIVLANQMIGVAAINEFGFKKYYGDQFFYSMPSGKNQTLYEHFLAMIYQDTTKETMNRAMSATGVNEGYFVLNSYWNNAEKIKAKAKKTADQIYEIDNGTVTIFKYSKD